MADTVLSWSYLGRLSHRAHSASRAPRHTAVSSCAIGLLCRAVVYNTRRTLLYTPKESSVGTRRLAQALHVVVHSIGCAPHVSTCTCTCTCICTCTCACACTLESAPQPHTRVTHTTHAGTTVAPMHAAHAIHMPCRGCPCGSPFGIAHSLSVHTVVGARRRLCAEPHRGGEGDPDRPDYYIMPPIHIRDTSAHYWLP